MDNRSALFARTEKLAAAVAEAMATVSSFIETGEDDIEAAGRCRFEAGVLKDSEKQLSLLLADCLTAVREEWNTIVQNDMLKDEVNVLTDSVRSFHSAAYAFDEAVCMHGIEADAVLGDSWLARRYLAMAADWEKEAAAVIDFTDFRRKHETELDGPFYGLARRLHKFFVGVQDDELKALVLNGVSLATRPRWLQDRRQAVVMGRTLGISCRDMNRSFLFLNRQGEPSPLNYSSDGPTLDYSCYEIYSIIRHLNKV